MAGSMDRQIRDGRTMTRSRVLTIDDDPKSGVEIVAELKNYGFSVDWVGDGREALARAIGGGYDAITLERMLPGIDGMSILAAMRTVGVQTPVLMLNVPDDVDERIRSLRARGDDYLTRPYNSGELMARLEGLIRRSQEPAVNTVARADSVLRVGPLELDLAARRVMRDGVEVALLPTECRVLEFMMRRVGQTVTRMMLFEAVWSYHFDPGTNLIEVHMSKLRKKIDVAGKESILKTVRGAGYVLAV
ncbi:Transcriptional activator protein CopR [Paraburkholderia solisilvae]|uniref:Transcriptional activator protein CopR n=2 Tax=Paraburkholderia solisilvae TaxID=624376 RepID=A0A6J5E4Y0_9BURK|nr:Transcriptional activator protein CopR [Paraburkholderia solisilvae]